MNLPQKCAELQSVSMDCVNMHVWSDYGILNQGMSIFAGLQAELIVSNQENYIKRSNLTIYIKYKMTLWRQGIERLYAMVFEGENFLYMQMLLKK